MKKFVLLLIGVFIAGVVHAASYKLAVVPTKNSILLKWPLLENVPLKDLEIKIYRKKGNEGWQKIKRIRPVTDLSAYDSYGEEAKGIVGSIIKGDYPPKEEEKGFNKDFYMFLIYLKTIVYPELAEKLGIFYEDKEVRPKESYFYKVSYFRKGKLIKTLLASKAVSLDEFRPLPQIRVEAKPLDKQVYLKWNLYQDYILYLIYRDERLLTPEGHFVEDKEGKRPFYFKDKGLNNFQEYEYKIVGIDVMGRRSEPAVVKVIPLDLTPPKVPTGLKVEIRNNKVYLTWDKNKEEDLQGYNVYRTQILKQPPKKLNSRVLRKNSFIDRDIKEGCHYWYAISAVDKYGNESALTLYKLAQIIDKTPPSPPAEVSGRAEPGKVILSWKPNTEKDLKGYRVYRRISEDGKWIMLNGGNIIGNPEYEDKNLPEDMDDVKLYYQVRAVDKSYNESKPSDTIALKLPDVTPPPAPSLLSYESGEDFVLLHFNSLSKDICKVYIEIEDAKGNLIREIETQEELVRVDGLVPNTVYNLKIHASDKEGNTSKIISLKIQTLRSLQMKKVKFKPYLTREKELNVINWKLPYGYGVIIYKNGKRITPLIKDESRFVDYDSKFYKHAVYKLEVFDVYGRKVEEKEIQTE